MKDMTQQADTGSLAASRTRTTLRPREAACVLGVSERTAYRWASEGKLPTVPRGARGGFYVPRAAFEAWLHVQAERAIESLEAQR